MLELIIMAQRILGMGDVGPTPPPTHILRYVDQYDLNEHETLLTTS